MRIFIKKTDINDDKIILNDFELINHIIKSLRMNKGDEIEASSQENLYICNILNFKIEKKIANLVLDIKKTLELKRESYISLFQGNTKATKSEFILQKMTECGILEINFVDMKRSIAKISKNKKERFEKIILEASMQSRRNKLPNLEFLSFKEMLDKLKIFDIIIIAFENEKYLRLMDIEDNIKKAQKIAILIGPEGGIDKEELKAFEILDKVFVISLGDKILRTETAGIYLLSQINYILKN